MFTTHANPMNDNCRASTPISAMIPLVYEGLGVTRDPSSYIETGYVQDKTSWLFNGLRTSNVAAATIPQNLRQYFGNKTSFAANDEISKTWLENIKTLDYWDQVEVFQYLGGTSDSPGIINAPIPYELTFEIPVTVHNSGSQTKVFSYIMQGHEMYVEYSIDGSGEDKYYKGYFPGNGVNQSYSQEVFHYTVQPGETVECVIKVTMITGSNPTVHHAFAINATEAQKSAPLLDRIEK